MADDSGTNAEGALTLDAPVVAKTPRRRALWGVLVAVAVAAGALAVSAGGDDDRALPTLPVALGSSGSDEALGAAAPATADMRIGGWITYVAGDDLPALGGEGPVYRLEGAVDEARVRALADTLGLTGDAVQEDGYWRLQSDDAILEVYEGGGYWWYGIQHEVQPVEGGGAPGCEPGPAVDCGVVTGTTPPVAATGSGASCTTSETKDGEVTEECVSTSTHTACAPDEVCTLPAPSEPPPPPADLPTEGAARQVALDLLASTGMDVADAKVTVDGPYDAWYVTVEPKLDGLAVSGWAASVSVGSKGAITSASGTLATPELLGDYPLIDTRAAVDRLNEQQQAFDDVPLGAPGTASSAREGATLEAPADDSATTVSVDGDGPATPVQAPAPPPTIVECTTSRDGAESCTGVGTAVDPGCFAYAPEAGVDVDAPATTYPCDPYAEPEAVEVVLHEAERVLVQLPSFDGSGDSYLLSGYRFSGDDGAVAEVTAVADESLAPAPAAEPAPETTEPAASCETLVEEDASGTTHTLDPCPPPSDPTKLEPGQTPEIGVGYYVDVNTHCGWFVLGDQWWATDAQTPLDWAAPTEGGTFTLSTPTSGTFVGDHQATKTAEFTARGPAEELPACA